MLIIEIVLDVHLTAARIHARYPRDDSCTAHGKPTSLHHYKWP